MVRPIEISDALSKVQAIERMQQNARAIPEAIQQFQKELSEKLADEKARTAQPAASGDRIILHADEHEKEDRRENEDRDGDTFEHREETPGDASAPRGDKPGNPPGHIDIRI
jgi:hypothetical protein